MRCQPGSELESYDELLLDQLRDIDEIPWFTFFTSGYCHIFAHFLRFIPDSLRSRLIVIVSNLDHDEYRYVASLVPTHLLVIDRLVDSKAVYELIYRTSGRPFGWVDVDCFVTQTSLFDELDAAVMDAPFAGPMSYGPIPILAAPLIAANPALLDCIADTLNVCTSPNAYSYKPSERGRDVPGSICRLVTDRHQLLLNQTIQFESELVPFPQGGILDLLDGFNATVRSHERYYHLRDGRRVEDVVFDGTVLMQLMCHAAGTPPARVRNYPGSKVINRELVHAGGISYWSSYYDKVLAPRNDSLPWSGHVDTLLLESFVREVAGPVQVAYAHRLDQRTKHINALGWSALKMRGSLAAYLEGCGVDCKDPRWVRLLCPTSDVSGP